ncbi:MAG: sulfate adenylyltransferase small subunit, partial [Verrucomicrobia bacterium]
AVESEAADLDAIIREVAAARKTERGTRADDKRSETAMEDRKKAGYF